MSVAGVSKLLVRGVAASLVVEVTRPRTLGRFLAANLAVTFGYASPKRGRPRLAPLPYPSLSAIFDTFDEEMAEIDRLLARH